MTTLTHLDIILMLFHSHEQCLVLRYSHMQCIIKVIVTSQPSRPGLSVITWEEQFLILITPDRVTLPLVDGIRLPSLTLIE